MDLETNILQCVDEHIGHWCTNCPDADHFSADITGPEEWVCSKWIYPGSDGCLRRDRYEDIQALARQIVEIMREIEEDIFNTIQTYLDRWCRHCPDAHHAIADITGPEEWWCMRKGVEPGGDGCSKRARMKEIEAKAAEIGGMV